ncbi:HDOD domain-containing protein [Catenovulum sp. SM1970]|uniref:HDOD domain-containing protein n=1 Tax=Marinifaba aquimaris TaxID=2741323 RepID=UPI0015722E48|nr:HDOD domain-containing protein [Marinifaba aquimaris]NTS76715.1 HDOD domain-containing protein [Marinifaba aquimaris]
MSSVDLNKDIHARFHNLLISYDFARRQLLVASGNTDDELGFELNKRELLEVEREAKETREVEQFHKAVNVQEMTVALNKEVEERFLEKIQDVELVIENVTQANDSIPAILDILAVRAASIARVDPLVANLPWLADELIQFVNLPQYRSASNKKKNVKVDKHKTALSYIGIENLPYVIPSFALKKWIPYSTEPFRLMKRKLWESGLAAALCCKKLAQLQELDDKAAFVCGMFHDLGKSAIVRLYLRTFDQIWKEKLTHARDKRLKEQHDALVELTPNPELLRDLLQQHSSVLSAKIIESFNLKRFIVLPAFEENAEQLEFGQLSPMAQVMRKGIAFSRYKTLQKHNLITKDEAKQFFKLNHISTQDVIELRKLSLKRLNLRLEHQ